MNNKILVVYASKYGSTAEIAEKIGKQLQKAGLEVDIIPAKQAGDLTPYRAVILGSAVFIGMWRKEALKFIKTRQETLKELPIWLFSSGPTGEGDPVELLKGWRYPKGLQSVIDTIQPKDITVFHGNVVIEKLNPLHKFMIGKVEAPVGDFRDWDAIAAWASDIAHVLIK